MWPGRVLVPSGVNSIAVGQCWWSAQCRPAVMVCTRHHVLVLLCVFQMSRSLPCDWTSALHGQRWYSTGLQHLWGHSTTKQAYSQSSINSRRTFFQWPVKKDLSEMKPPPSLQMLFTHLSCTVHQFLSEKPDLIERHTVCMQHLLYPTQIKHASETNLYGTLTMHTLLVRSWGRTSFVRSGRFGSDAWFQHQTCLHTFSVYSVYSRWNVHRAASACFFTQ